MGKKAGGQEKTGIWSNFPKHKARPNDPEVRVVDTSYDSDSLAELIVHAWTDQAYSDRLTEGAGAPAFAKAELAKLGINLKYPRVVTEATFYKGWELEHEDEVVLVIPKKDRAELGGPPLLETAKLLMACVPNGI
jgi:hypothetical protein